MQRLMTQRFFKCEKFVIAKKRTPLFDCMMLVPEIIGSQISCYRSVLKEKCPPITGCLDTSVVNSTLLKAASFWVG